MYTSFLSTWKLLSFNKTCCCVIPFNGFVIKRFKATALNLVKNLEESTSKATVTTTTTTKYATTLSCVQAHHRQHKPQEHAVELTQKLKTPHLLHLVSTNRKLSFYDTSNAPSGEDTFRKFR
ncbi:hypothetical protein GQX74_000367 [Glossina fuscipes]|nr:hypothetical protein GQX74_000367 [Glossina fuscipes]